MALQVWLPLTKDLSNQGLNNMTFSSDAGSNIVLDNNGKIGKCYSRTSKQTSGKITSNSTINLSEDISMACWALVSDCVGNTANGLISNHSNVDKTGVGITVKQISTSDYRISCSTGTGSDRTFYTYYGTTNIKDAWHHLALTYSKSAKQLILYVDGNAEYTLNNYVNSSIADYIVIFDWSTTYNNTSYRPAAKLNDVRIYDHCLSPKEVKEISKGLVLHYPLNDIYNGSYNLLNDSDTFTNWGYYEAGYTEIKINEFGRKSLIITNKRSWCGATHSVQIPSAGTYTISCYCKPISRTKTSIEQTLYISGNGLNDQYVKVDWNKTNQWQRLSLTRTYNQAGSFFIYLIAYGGSRTDDYKVTCEYTMPQVTKTDTTVPYVEKSIPDSTVYDCSGYQNNGTINGSLSCSADSPRYKISTHFTSSIPSRINLPSDMSCLSGNNEQTLSCWVKSSGLGSGMIQSGLIALGYGNSLFLSDSDYWYRIDNGSDLGIIGANQNPHDGKWHLVTATYKSGIASIYIDGVLKNNVSRTFSNRYINTGGNRIGTEVNNSPVYNLNGDISDIRMYTTALSADDIKELYNTSAYVSDNGTLLTYNLEE